METSSIFGIELEIDPSPSPMSVNYPKWIVQMYDDGDAAITCPPVHKRCGKTAIVNYDDWVGMPDKTTKKGNALGKLRACPYCSIHSRIPE